MPSTRARELHESLVTLVDSSAFQLLFAVAFKPQIDDLKDDLCRNLAMTEAQRLGKQYAFQALEEGFERIFKAANRDMPEWLLKEFRFKDE